MYAQVCTKSSHLSLDCLPFHKGFAVGFLLEHNSYCRASAFELHVPNRQQVDKPFSSKECWRYYILPQGVVESFSITSFMKKKKTNLKLI